MTFDLLSETRISLIQLAREQNISLSTAWRWCLHGCKGHVLESFSIGGKKFTSEQAFRRFVAATSSQSIPIRTNRQRATEQRAANKVLDEAGLLPA